MKERKHSSFLLSDRPLLTEAIRELASDFDYISVLGTDDKGLSFSATPGETKTSEPMWVQRGFVFRAQKAGHIVEYACDALPENGNPHDLATLVGDTLDSLFSTSAHSIHYPPIPDEPFSAEFVGKVELDTFEADPEILLNRLSALREKLTDGHVVVMAQSRFETVDVSRMFISPNRSLIQSFTWSQAYLFGIARREQQSKMSYRAVSGRKGYELLDQLESLRPELTQELAALLDAIKIEPGEYEVILDPDVAGTLAHEAFGHGVETDMFFKGRAKAIEYLGKRVGSDLVNMFDGALGVDQTGSYLFDDEGRNSTKTTVIEKGILKNGISDTLSALALGLPLTGNGRRQAFSHKAYARMTNTYFAPGSSNFADMLASVKRGWLISRLNSGMEDPRNWGIQLIAMIGREIVDGALTGRVASPVVLSGYVPDVLSSIDMVSDDFQLSGSGYCGKGYKEYVKVSSGGPYVKTRMRLG
jgi:TldD protein